MARATTESLRRFIEISPQAYHEIEEALLAAGFDWLVYPGSRHINTITLDGFTVLCREEAKAEEAGEWVDAGGCAPPIYAKARSR